MGQPEVEPMDEPLRALGGSFEPNLTPQFDNLAGSGRRRLGTAAVC